MKSLMAFLFLFLSGALKAEEGMWLPHLLGQQKYAEMKAKGLKLSADQIYSINKASIKDAIALVSTGCSGEMVSAEGLLFTNHHCVYGALADVSKDYASSGFYATNKAEEIPLPGIWVLFLVKVEDISRQVEDSMKLYPNWNNWQAKKGTVFGHIQEAADATNGNTNYVYSMFNENQFLLYTFERFTDIRLVGIPPASMGAFGGETDNWEYPRHAADFGVLRVYTNATGKPAKYHDSNIPYHPKYVLPISLKGYKENDFTMTLGYPGNTSRYQTSYGIRLATDFTDPSIVRMRQIRLQALEAVMKKDAQVKKQLAPEYAGVANYWKYYAGEIKQSKQHHVYEGRKKQEEALAAWATGKPEYADLFRNYERTYAAWVPYARHREYYEEGIMGPNVMSLANQFEGLEKLLVNNSNPKQVNADLIELDSIRTAMLQETNLEAEEQMLWKLVKAFHDDMAVDQQPVLFYNLMKQGYGALNDPETYQLWAKNVFEQSLLLQERKWKQFMKQPDAGSLQSDPLYNTAFAFRENWKKYRTQRVQFSQSISDLNHQHLKAIRQMNGNKPMYPDANASMRISYGNIKGYKVNDTATVKYYCTATELLDKYLPGDFEFDLPAKAVTLLKNKDYGRYADAIKKDLLVSFVSTDDQTGGSSGSPLLNAYGQLIGISYDANIESLANRFVYDKNTSRVINLDIRYMLWCIDKLAGASYIIKELKIVP